MDKQLVGVKFQRLQLKALKETEGNPQIMSDDEFNGLVESIKQKGWLLDPAVAWLRPDGEYQIISGHHRVRAAIEAGLVEADVKVVEGLTDEQARLLVLEANQRRGRFDMASFDSFIDRIIGDFDIDIETVIDEIGLKNTVDGNKIFDNDEDEVYERKPFRRCPKCGFKLTK